MNTKDARNALKAALVTAATFARVSWPNVEPTADGLTPARPYAEVTFSGQRRTVTDEQAETLKGNEVDREVGLMHVAVIVAHGGGEDAALELADTVSELFYAGRRITFTGGTAIIRKRPDIGPGFRDDGDWRITVSVPYEAIAS